MKEERRKIYVRLAVQLTCAAVAVMMCALLGGIVLDILLPFILAFIMAWAFNPVIRVLQERLKLTRRIFSLILVLAVYAVLLGLCLLFVGQVVAQVLDLVSAMPSIIAQLQRAYNRFSAYVRDLLALLPPEYDGLQAEILQTINSGWNSLRQLITTGLSRVVSMTSGIALSLPSFVIFLTVLVLASCIITADFPNLRESIYGYLGKQGKNSVRLMGHSFRTAVLGFFRSQLIFALVDMAIILVAFFIIGVPYPLPIALLLCFLDFIPFFGAGTVLVPWGIICLVLGFTSMGAQLILLYAILYILRRIFEPRVLGGATGFSSLQMLFSMYAGMKLYGVTGLVIAPIIWIAAVNFLRTGIFSGVISDLQFVISDMRAYIARPVPTKTTEPPEPSVVRVESKKSRFAFFGRKES